MLIPCGWNLVIARKGAQGSHSQDEAGNYRAHQLMRNYFPTCQCLGELRFQSSGQISKFETETSGRMVLLHYSDSTILGALPINAAPSAPTEFASGTNATRRDN